MYENLCGKQVKIKRVLFWQPEETVYNKYHDIVIP
jgi:hypothetical protein